MKRTLFSRRQFLQSTAAGAGLGSLSVFSRVSKSPAAEPMPSEGPTVHAGRSMSIRTFSEPFPQHAELLLRRSENARQELRQSLAQPGARPVTVAAYQMANHCGGEQGKKANLDRMLDAVRHLSTTGAQILAFPEMCLSGYFTPLAGTPAEATAANHALADEVGRSHFLDNLQGAAREARMVLAFGFCEKSQQAYYNSIGVIDADGAWLGTRRKNPLYPYPYETESFAEPDSSQRSTVFKTRYATIGVSNCFDGEFPESIREMRLNGAELLVWCNAGLGDSVLGSNVRINQSGAHAQSNWMWVVCCNCTAKNSLGMSNIVGPNGEHLVILPPGEEAFAQATINLAQTANWDTWRLRLGPQWKLRTKRISATLGGVS